MAIAVTAQIVIAGGDPLTDYHSISIRQDLFNHHSFQVVVPYELLETARGDGFFHQAHTEYCGKPITIMLTPVVAKAPPLQFKGIITNIALSNSGDFAHSFVLSGYSLTYLLEDGAQRRTFLKKGLKEIFTQVLQPYSQAVPSAGPLNPQHKEVVKYATQYGESPYAFLRRLADEYGEWFYYDGLALCLGSPPHQEVLTFAVQGPESFNLAFDLQPTRFELSRYDYLAHKPYHGTSESQSLSQLNPLAAAALAQSGTLFPEPARLLAGRHVRSQQQLNETVKGWKENQVSGLVTLQGTGENSGFAVGRVMAVQGTQGGKTHDYGHYRLTEVLHTVQADQYQNSFVALPDAAKHPPANPQVHSPQGVPELAEVIDVADPQHLGRVRVRYYWPVKNKVDAETGWVRVSTPYSGTGKGHLFTPEVGSQVLVGYEESQAEFPLVLGNLFHPQNAQKAKYSFADNAVKGLQTAGGNKITLHDKAGEERILISNGQKGKRQTKLEVSFAKDGAILLKTKGSITLDAATKISLISKEIELQADEKIVLDSSRTVDIQGGAAVKVGGQTLDLEAQTTAKLAGQTGVKVEGLTAELSGTTMTTVKGTLVKIN